MNHTATDTTRTVALAAVLPFPGSRERMARRAIREIVEIRGERLGASPTDRRDARIAANLVLRRDGAVERAVATAKRVMAFRVGGAA